MANPKPPLHYVFVGLSPAEYEVFEAKRRALAVAEGREISRANYLRMGLNNMWAEEDGDAAQLCELQVSGRPRKTTTPGSPADNSRDRSQGGS